MYQLRDTARGAPLVANWRQQHLPHTLRADDRGLMVRELGGVLHVVVFPGAGKLWRGRGVLRQ